MTHDCEPFESLAARSHEQVVSADEANALAGHLAVCPGCRVALALAERLRNLGPRSTHVPPQQTEPAVPAAVRRLLAQDRRRLRSRSRRAAAALVFGVLMAVGMGLAGTWLWLPLLGFAASGAAVLVSDRLTGYGTARFGSGTEALLEHTAARLRWRLRAAVPAAAFTLLLGMTWALTCVVEPIPLLQELGFHSRGLLGLLPAFVLVAVAVVELAVVAPRLRRQLQILGGP